MPRFRKTELPAETNENLTCGQTSHTNHIDLLDFPRQDVLDKGLQIISFRQILSQRSSNKVVLYGQ